MSDSSPLPPNIINNNNNKPNKYFLLFFVPCFSSPTSITSTNSIPNPSPPTSENTMKVLITDVDDDVTAAAMRKSVKEINFGGWEEKEKAAAEIKRIARSDAPTRRLLAELGVVRALVAMLVDAEDDRRRRVAVDALVEMASGTFTNKARIVDAGLLSNLPHLMRIQSFAKDRQFAHLLLSISSLAKTQFPIPCAEILPFLINILNANEAAADREVKLTCIATLYNLSTKLDNRKAIVASGALHSLLAISVDGHAAEGALATLANLVPSTTGKKAIQHDPLVPNVFIQILTWDDKPKCQELAAYLLVVIAHGNSTERQKMLARGIVPVLLEVALLGSPVARKRALKLLQWFKEEGQSRMVVHSGPQARRIVFSSGSGVEEEVAECREAVKSMVRQSLDKNMALIMRRADGLEGSALKALVCTSSSKSLPY